VGPISAQSDFLANGVVFGGKVMGMINYFYKEDQQSARRDFQKFCEQAEPTGIFTRSVEFAKKYLVEIESKLGPP
jgi:hypothetical protein